MARDRNHSSGVEVAPLLIIGVLTLVALSLWLWRGARLETAVEAPSLQLRSPGGSVEKPAPRVAPEPSLQVPRLPEGVVSGHWRAQAGQAVLARPDGSTLALSLRPKVQKAIQRYVSGRHVPYGAVVLMDPRTGAIHAWVEHQEAGDPVGAGHGLTRAKAPAASVFKVVTAAALLEAGARPSDETCFHGGRRGITDKLLKDSDADKRCESLAQSLAHSRNVPFGKQAVQRLSAGALTATAEDLFFGRALPFDVETGASWVQISDERVSLARSAAGFVGTSLSPLHGAVLAATVANDGVMMRPWLVAGDSLQPGLKRKAAAIGRVLPAAVARDLRDMMRLTLSEGTARRQFARWPKSLADVEVAGKTGTLSRTVDGTRRNYTWFIGFAPADDPEIAVAALAVNGPRWHTRGPSMARQALSAWFRDARAGKKARASAPVRAPAAADKPAAGIASPRAPKKSDSASPRQG